MENEKYLSEMITEFQTATANRKEDIIECLRAEGFEDEARDLEEQIKDESLNHVEDDYTAIKDENL